MSDNKIHLPDIEKGRFWNKGPMVVTGCTYVSEGCDRCWSEKNHAMRLSNLDVAHIYSPELMTDGRFNGKVQFNLHLLEKAVKTRKPHVIAIWNDLYHEGVTLEQVTDAHCIMAENPQHKFLIVTKRPERAAGYVNGVIDMVGIDTTIPEHMYHIVTMENQARVEERMPHLLEIPGKRGIIIEPMLGPVDLRKVKLSNCDEPCEGHRECATDCTHYYPAIHQVILGGETGTGARPIHPDWVRSVRDQCEAAGVPFFFKSWGEWLSYGLKPSEWPASTQRYTFDDGQDMIRVGQKLSGRLLDGREHNDLAWMMS